MQRLEVAVLSAKYVTVDGLQHFIQQAVHRPPDEIAHLRTAPGHDVQHLGQLAVADDLRAVDVGAGLGMAARAGDGDAVDGGVDLAVAAAVEPMAVGVAGADRDRRDAAGAGEFGVAGERWAPAISPISLPAVSGPKPGSASSCGAA